MPIMVAECAPEKSRFQALLLSLAAGSASASAAIGCQHGCDHSPSPPSDVKVSSRSIPLMQISPSEQLQFSGSELRSQLHIAVLPHVPPVAVKRADACAHTDTNASSPQGELK
jgi:hypothetical protein